MPQTPLAYKMNAKLKKDGVYTLSHSMPYWYINEENC
jgi:hypothetical protein